MPFSFAGQRGINAFATEILRGIDGIHLSFVTETAFEASEAIEMFLDTGASGATRDASDYRINFAGDGSIAILNWGDGTNNDVASSGITLTVTQNGDGAILHAYIPYAFLGIQNTDIFGVSFGVWSGVLSDWDGWGYDGFIAPEIPSQYVRVALDNSLYKAPSNVSTVIVSGNAGQSGVTVAISEITTQSDETGAYSLIVPEATNYSVSFTKQGFIAQTMDLVAGDFTNGATTLDVTLDPYLNTISGSINEDGVTVTVVGTDITTTSSGGTYTLSGVPTTASLTITFEKDGFTTVSETLDIATLNGPAITLDITIHSRSSTGTLEGSVADAFGALEGVTVTITETGASTTTDATGAFAFVDIVMADYTLTLSLDGYPTTTYDILSTDFGTQQNLHLYLAPGTTGVFSGKDSHPNFDPIEGSIVREEDGFRFTFTTTEEFQFDGTNKEVVELFIDTGASGTARDASDYLFMLRSDGTFGIVNWAGGGNEDPSTIVFTNDSTTMEVFIPYAFLGIASTDIIGISLGQWNDFASDWDGWAYNGTFVAPENPQAYVRIGLDNQLYEAPNNDPVSTVQPGTTGIFSGKDTHPNFDPIEGSIVREETGIRFTFTTTEEFQFDGTNKEVVELFIDTGASGTTRDATDYLFMLRSDGSLGIVNWAGGGNEDPSTIVFTNDSTTMEVFIPYAFLGIQSTDIIGISLGQWNDFASDWDGWAYNGTFVAPENPQAYVRIGLDNQLYQAADNNQ
jgi:hypothetical protein